MKFEENTTVYNSLQEAQQAEQQQKQQLSQSISEYEQALKQQQDTYNQQNASVIEQNKQIEQANKVKQDEYEQKKQQYETDLANFENTKNEYEDWYRDQKQQLDIGIAKLVGDFDDTQAGSLRFYQNLTLTYDKDKLAESGTEVTDEDIKFTPGKSSISNVQSDSEARITNNQADSEGRKYVTRFDLGIGITPGTKATFDLHNIGTTKSGKIISAHVKFVLDKTTDVNTQFGVVPNRLLAIYFYNNRTADQKGHFEVEFFDEATGEPMKLITAFVSSDIDVVTEKNYVGSDGKIDGKIPTLRSDPRSNKYPEIGNVSANEIISLGDNIYVEKMNFQGLAKRSTKTEKNDKGRFKRKKRFGKSIANRAPSMLLEIIDRKLSYYGKRLIKIDTWSAKASQFNHFDGTYNKKKLSQRWNDFNGVKVQRDLYSAFLIMNTADDLKSFDIDKCNERFNNFYRLHNLEVERLTGYKNLGSIGI